MPKPDTCKADRECTNSQCCIRKVKKYASYNPKRAALGNFYSEGTKCAKTAAHNLLGGKTCECGGQCKSGECRMDQVAGTMTCTAPAPVEGADGSFCEADDSRCDNKCCDKTEQRCTASAGGKDTGEKCKCDSMCRSNKCEESGMPGFRSWTCAKDTSHSDGDYSEMPRNLGAYCLHDTHCASKCCQFPNPMKIGSKPKCFDFAFLKGDGSVKEMKGNVRFINKTLAYRFGEKEINGPHFAKDGEPCECDIHCESRNCNMHNKRVVRKCAALNPKEAAQKVKDVEFEKEIKAANAKSMAAFGTKDVKKWKRDLGKEEARWQEKMAAEKAKSKIMADLWSERKDLVGLGGEGQSCLTTETKFMGTPACPVGQTCSSEGLGGLDGTCAPDWENQRYSFGKWKGMMMTTAERAGGEYWYKLHKGCITAKECTYWNIPLAGGVSRTKKTQSFYAAADPKTLPNWWRSNEALFDAVQHKLPGLIARGGNIIDFKTPPSSSSHKLMPGQYCGDKSTCKKWCVDPTSFDSPGASSNRGFFCWEIKAPIKCRPDVLPDCRGKLQCMDDANGIATCENPTGDKGKRLIALKEKKAKTESTVSFAEDPLVCASKCRSEQPCTGSNGNGIQKRTVFTTQSAVGSKDGTPSGPAGPAAGEFRTIPTPLTDISVFGTGQCFECLLGADDHFRCPVHGRRSRLVDRSGALRGFAGMSGLKNPQHLDEALNLALYAAPDACFNHNPQSEDPKGPFRMLREQTTKVSLRFNLQVYFKSFQPLVSNACQAVTPPYT